MSPSSWMRFSGHQVNSSFVFQALSLIFLSIASAQNTSPGTITIQNSPSFSSQRPCAQECFTGEWGGDLGSGCPSPIENACYCRPDLASAAIYTLSSCVYNGCSENANDVQTAIGLYSAYCDVTAQLSTIVTAGATAASPAGTVTTIIVTSSTNSLTANPSIVNPTSSNRSNDPSPTTSSGGTSSTGLSAGAIGGITVAGFVTAVIFGVLGICYARKTYIMQNKKRKAKAERTHHEIAG